MKPWIVTAKEERSFVVTYLVVAKDKTHARALVDLGLGEEYRAEMTSSVSQKIIRVKENK